MSQTHHLYIAGQRITVRSPIDSERVQALAAMVDARVRQATQSGANLQTAALLAALALADELKGLREGQDRQQEAQLEGLLLLSADLDLMAKGKAPPEAAAQPEPPALSEDEPDEADLGEADPDSHDG